MPIFLLHYKQNPYSFQVYTSQRVDYSGGNFFGQECDEPTRTLLAFMISSVSGSYEDVVCFVPVVTLNSGVLRQHFSKVVEELGKIGFATLVSITDNHKTNLKFFTELGAGVLR